MDMEEVEAFGNNIIFKFIAVTSSMKRSTVEVALSLVYQLERLGGLEVRGKDWRRKILQTFQNKF